MILGIESTAHTLGIGGVENGDIVLDERDSYKPEGEFLGMVPIEVAKHHREVKDELLNKAEKNIDWEQVERIAFSQGPGLPPCLSVGKELALDLKKEHKKPVVGVNHCVAHIEIGKLLTKSEDPIVLFVSGGNTQVLGLASGRYRIFGETEDISVGNALDTFARSIGIPYPGAPEVEKKAKEGSYIPLPYVVKGMDLSFSGIVTEATNRVKKGEKVENVCFSLQEHCFSMLTEVVERALAHTGKQEVLVVGGVAANQRLREMMGKMCEERGADMYIVPQKYSGDNPVMIAYLGSLAECSSDLDIRPRWRTDQVEVTWS